MNAQRNIADRRHRPTLFQYRKCEIHAARRESHCASAVRRVVIVDHAVVVAVDPVGSASASKHVHIAGADRQDVERAGSSVIGEQFGRLRALLNRNAATDRDELRNGHHRITDADPKNVALEIQHHRRTARRDRHAAAGHRTEVARIRRRTVRVTRHVDRDNDIFGGQCQRVFHPDPRGAVGRYFERGVFQRAGDTRLIEESQSHRHSTKRETERALFRWRIEIRDAAVVVGIDPIRTAEPSE